MKQVVQENTLLPCGVFSMLLWSESFDFLIVLQIVQIVCTLTPLVI